MTTKHIRIISTLLLMLSGLVAPAGPVHAITDEDAHCALGGYNCTYYLQDDCDATAATTGGSNTVVLDPGHSGPADMAATAEVDSTTSDPGNAADGGATYEPDDVDGSGIESVDNDGAPDERATMWTAANDIKAILTKAGYNVILTKSSADDEVGLIKRAEIANAANAAIAVSLHFTGGIQFGSQSAHWGVTPQATTVDGQPAERTNQSNGKSMKFTNTALAATSLQYAQDIQQERAKAGDPVSLSPLDQSFPAGRGLPSYGNISIVQLFSKVPWVYNEDGSIGFNTNDYVNGIANGIMKAVPLTTAASGSSSTSGLPTLTGSDNVQKAFNYLSSTLGLSPAQAAGIVGNLMWESGGGVTLRPNADEQKGTATSPTPNDGFGIAQWTPADSQQGLVNLASKENVQPDNLAVQLQYLAQELTGQGSAPDESAALKAVKATSNVDDATTAFMNQFEHPGTPDLAQRIAAAESVLKTDGGGAPGSPSGSSTGGSDDCASTTSSTGDNSISQEATDLAWPKSDCQQTFTDSAGIKETRSSCFDATNAYNKAWDGASDKTDCGAFVATVMHSSNSDPKYPASYTPTQEQYVTSHPSLYKVISTKSTAGLAAGDILVAAFIGGGSGHTAIYLGGTTAAASLGGHTPQIDAASAGEVAYILSGSPEAAVQFIGNGGGTQAN